MEKIQKKTVKACPRCGHEFNLTEGRFIQFQCPGCKIYLKYKYDISESTSEEEKIDFSRIKKKAFYIIASLTVLLIVSINFLIFKLSELRILKEDLANEKALNGNYKLCSDEFLQALKKNDRVKMKNYMSEKAYAVITEFINQCNECGDYRLSNDGKQLYYRNRAGKEVYVPLRFSVVNKTCQVAFD